MRGLVFVKSCNSMSKLEQRIVETVSRWQVVSLFLRSFHGFLTIQDYQGMVCTMAYNLWCLVGHGYLDQYHAMAVSPQELTRYLKSLPVIQYKM